MSLFDPIGTFLSILSTYYFTKAHNFAWLIAIPAILINFLLYWQKGIYGHALLDLLYLLMTLYGFFLWKQSNAKKPNRKITRMPLFAYPLIMGCCTFAILVLSYILKIHFQSDIYYWDAASTVLALTAQFMLCQKWIECWLLWFIVDAMIAIINWQQGIPFHSLHHAVYLWLAVLGYQRWSSILEAQNKVSFPSQHAI